MLERHEVETFLTLAEELHFGRTGARLRLTTGRVSQTIKKLERRVGAPLFERTSRTVRLTAIGTRLAEDLAPHVTGIEEALRRAMEAGRSVTGLLRISSLGTGVQPAVLRAVGLFTSRHPECAVRVYESQIDSAQRMLFDGDIDILFASYPFPPNVVCGPPLISERRMLAMAADHPLATRTSVSLEDFAEHPVIQLPDHIDEAYRSERTPIRTPSGRPVLAGPIGGTFTEILTLVAMGKGVYPVGAHVEQYYPRPDIAYLPIDDAPAVDWGPAWLESNDTARVRAFAQAAADVARPGPTTE